MKGQWVYYYRAIDKQGQTLDCYLSPKRDLSAAKDFFEKVIKSHGPPEKVTIDNSGANFAALVAVNHLSPQMIKIRQNKYLNNRLEQDHRFIKRLTKSMLGFKSMVSAAATLAGIELHHMIRKNQHQQAANFSLFEQFYALAA